MKKRNQVIAIWMLNSPRAATIRMVGFTTLLLFVAVIALIPALWSLWPIPAVIFVITARLCGVVVLDQQGVRVYRIFRKPIQILWENATHCGVFKVSFLRETSWYIYFSTKAAAVSPHDGLPDMSGDFVYLSKRDSLRSVIEKNFGKQSAKSVFGNSDNRECESWPLSIWFSVIIAYSIFGALFVLKLKTGNNLWGYISILPGLYALLVTLGRFVHLRKK